MEEREVVDRLNRGEVGARESLVRRYHARAGAGGLPDHSRLRHGQGLAQDAFVRAYKGIG
jgi:hypothetical protein